MFKSKTEIIRHISIVTIALAGLVHLLIVPAHYAHAPAHGIFFALASIVQIAWAVAFWRRPSLTLYRAGLAVSGGLVVLWAFTLALPAPFGGHGASSIDASAIVCKASELIGLISLVALAAYGGQLAIFGQVSVPKLVVEALVVSMIVGAGSFGLAKAAEPLFPGLGHVGEYGHNHEDNQANDHDSNEHSHAGEHSHTDEHEHVEEHNQDHSHGHTEN
jgi:hypothetical protein